MGDTTGEVVSGQGRKVFLSHSSADKPQVEALRDALEQRGIACYLDALELRAGDALTAELKEAVKGARAFLVVLSPSAVSSAWVKKEIEWALGAEDLAAETKGKYRFLPVLTGGLGVGFLNWLGRKDLLAIDASKRRLSEIAGDVAQALGVLPVDARPRPAPAPLPPIAELLLDFSDLTFEVQEKKERVRGRLRVEHKQPRGPAGAAVSLAFESPLGAIELGELRWYVETWPSWAFGRVRTARAKEVEKSLLKWGRDLYDRCFTAASAPITDFERGGGERRVVVQVPVLQDTEGSSIDAGERTRRLAANVAAARLLALPWELLRDEDSFLFEGKRAIRVVRRLPRKSGREPLDPHRRILRVLLLVARASDAGWIDPRVSLTPLVEALAPLGDRVELVVPADGSLKALDETLQQAEREKRPFHVVHFDGHGVYDRDKGLGQLVFEDDADCAAGKIERSKRLVDAKEIGQLLRDHRIPLFVLEACQTAQADAQVTSSVAAELVAAGIGSVVAMSHSVLVETARRFVTAFYPALARGERIGTAMVEAQAALALDPDRAPQGLPRWEMQDWFVPVLFQEDDGDVRLLPEAGLPLAADVELVRKTARGETPKAPSHGFVGRDRELLALSRLLHVNRVVLLRGTGGLGKTVLAAECARWLLDVQRVRRLAWTSVEKYGSAEAVLQSLGGQLVADFQASRFESLEKARQEIERALRDRRALLVIDNFESVATNPDPALVPILVALASVGETRLLVTGRESAPGLRAVELQLGALEKRTGRTLVEQVLRRGRQAPREEAGDSADSSWIDELVEAVGGHPRSLVRLAPEVAQRGAKVTRELLAPLMVELERRNPGDRENSLLASVGLSLARLGEKQRVQVRALSVFHGAAHAWVLAQVLEVEPDKALEFCRELVGLGLAEAEGPYLLPDPALRPAVEAELEPTDRERLEARWLEAASAWVGFLYEQRNLDASIAMAGVKNALGELLSVVEAWEQAADAGKLMVEAASAVVGRVEQLLHDAGNARALALVAEARERLAKRLGGWIGAAFEARRLTIERQRQAGDLAGALRGAIDLRHRAQEAGPGAYEGAAYNIAMSAMLLSDVLDDAGRADEALRSATEAEAEFRVLAKSGSSAAVSMAAGSLAMKGNALSSLGRLEEAAACYLQAIEEGEALGAKRNVAAYRGQLGTVRMHQRRYADAIVAYDQARHIFEDLGEPAAVATAWHQIGMVNQAAGQSDAAERAYLRSLEIETRHGNRRGQASTLNQLGGIYGSIGRHEEAADRYGRAASISAEVGDLRSEGVTRNNLADSLRSLGRPAEARAEILRAIELKAPFGHTALPWTTWSILADIERDLGNADAAADARQRAIDSYAAYRRAGGYALQRTGQLVEQVRVAIGNGSSPEAIAQQLKPPDNPAANVAAFYAAFRAMLAGGRDPALAANPALDYDDAVELTLLLEQLVTR
jgi:tetratricopeptide (TPR) repeat protein